MNLLLMDQCCALKPSYKTLPKAKPCIARLFSRTAARLIVSTDGQNFLLTLRCTNFWRSASQLLTLPDCRAVLESEAGVRTARRKTV